MLRPYAGRRLRQSMAGDLSYHVSGVVEARNALAERQFPIRVAPRDLDGMRYPLFQYYGNFPYTAAGSVFLLDQMLRPDKASPFFAWKLTVFACLTLAGWYTYRCGYAATRRAGPSAVAGVLFMTAPYMWADLHARFAYPELIAFTLLPAAAYYALRCYASPRWGYVLCSAVAWALVALSHNVAFLYGSTFLGLYFLSHFAPTRKAFRRLLRVGVGYGLGVVLVAWYVVPQLYTLDRINFRIEGGNPRPVGAEALTPIDVLLSPLMRSPEMSNTPRLGLQVGWPVLAVATLALLHLLNPLRRNPYRLVTARLLVVFAVAFFVTWSPRYGPQVDGVWVYDFWRFAPRPYVFVLSTYRILMFVTLFGALLAPYALALTFRRRPMRPWVVVLSLTVVGAASLSYVPRHRKLPRDAIAKLVEAPNMVAYRDYLITPPVAAQTSWFHPDVNWALPVHGLIRDLRVQQPNQRFLPVPRAGGLMLVEGTTPAPARLLVSLNGKPLAPASLPQGDFSVTLPLPGPFDADAVPFQFRAEREPEGGEVPIEVKNLRLSDAAGGSAVRFVPADEARLTLTGRRRMRYISRAGEATLVQLPVLHYPSMLRVRDRHAGREQDIPYGNVGRLLAFELPPGEHRVEVRFVGVQWANVVSAAGWGAVVFGAGYLTLRNLRKRLRRAAPAARGFAGRPRREFPLIPAATSAALLYAMLAAAPHWRAVLRLIDRPLDAEITASREAGPDHAAAKAFDYDPDTEWIAGGSAPASLTIVPREPRTFRQLVLEPRQSGLLEGWHRVRVAMFLDGERVSDQEFHLPDADKEPVQTIDFAEQRADRVEIHFTEPVTLTRDGTQRVSPDVTNPGYREIRLR